MFSFSSVTIDCR